MEHHVTKDLDSRLRAARPTTACADEDAFDAELLARVRDQPIARRRTVPRAVAVPVAAGVTLTATALAMLADGPGDVGGPSSAAAISQTLRWLNPPAGTILHTRSVETGGGRTTTRELWQSADDRGSERQRVGGTQSYESSGDAFYDPATDTIYDPPGKPGTGADGKPRLAGEDALPAGDPIVAKVRFLLQEGRMVVTGRERHNGTLAWEVSLKPDVGRPVWTLWVSATDGKPLELRDPGRDANEAPQVVRWPVYEVLRDADEDRLLTLTGAHPSADVVRDRAETAAAEQRLLPPPKRR